MNGTVCSPKPLQVLVVEDDPHQRFYIRSVLSRGPQMRVGMAASAAEALEMLARRQWDLVIADIGLPDMTGLELVARIRRSQPGLPTLILSASRRIADGVAAVELGVAGFMNKPPNPWELRAKAIALASQSPAAPRVRRRVLAIGAHPDDVEIGCGASLLRHKEAGDEIVVLTLSGGEAGGVASARANEAHAAAKELHASLVLASLPDTQISATHPTIGVIEREVRSLRPDLVYTHSLNERHQDHRAVHQATLVAAREVPNVYAYESPSTTREFRPQRFVDISDQLSAKLRLLECYRSQQGRRPYLDPQHIESCANYWGRFANYAPSEAFEVIRELTAARSTVAPGPQARAGASRAAKPRVGA